MSLICCIVIGLQNIYVVEAGLRCRESVCR